MKKAFLAICVCAIFFAASTVWAVPSTNVPGGWTYLNADTILGYEYLQQGNETEALTFANAVLAVYGMAPTELLNGTGEKITFQAGPNDIILDPGFAWVYAVVKVDGPNDYSYLFWDTYAAGGDNILQTPTANTFPYNMIDTNSVPPGPLGISGITFFGPSSVPEPMTLLLLGFGLVGMAGARRVFKK